MRPPAPATISRMSDMRISPSNLGCRYTETQLRRKVMAGRACSAGRQIDPLWLRLTAFDDQEIELGFAFAQRSRRLVIRRAITIERRTIAWELKHDSARAHFALHHLTLAAPDQESPGKFAKRHHVGGHIRLVAFGIGDIDMPDPIAFACRSCRWHGRGMRLHAVIALDDHEVANRMGKAQPPRTLIFRRTIASKRGGIDRKFAQYVARATHPLDYLLRAGAHQRASAILLVGSSGGCHVSLVSFRVVHVDMWNPITLRHLDLAVMTLRRRFPRESRRQPS